MPEDAGAVPAIELRDVVQSFGGKERVLSGVSLQVPARRTSFLLGPSGSGKSVLLKHVVALLRPESGEVRVFGRALPEGDLVALNEVRRRFGYLFQGAALFDTMTVFENVAFPLRAHRRGMGRSELSRVVAETLSEVGLDPRATLDKLPSELSGGMLKRVALARAVVLRPDILLYDEPTTGLDPVNRLTVNEMIAEAEERFGLTNFVISHDLDAALALAHRIAFLHQGRIIFCGSPDEFACSEHEVIVRFLGAAQQIRKRRRRA